MFENEDVWISFLFPLVTSRKCAVSCVYPSTTTRHCVHMYDVLSVKFFISVVRVYVVEKYSHLKSLGHYRKKSVGVVGGGESECGHFNNGHRYSNHFIE